MESLTEKNIVGSITSAFRDRFATEPLVVRSPGRVNLIGEHTDYNDGFVLPAAINKAIYVGVAPSGDEQCTYVAYDLQEDYSTSVQKLERIEGHWSLYINSVVDQLQKANFDVPGFNCVIGGDIPTGAGMSSSAAVECAVIYALNELFGFGLDPMRMVKMAQKAENVYVGVQCGIMDQFASMFGKKGHVIKLDCRSLEYEYEPFELDNIEVVLFDTNIKHSLASSEYNTRREQCEAGIALIREHHPEVKKLRDVTVEMLHQYVEPKDPLVFDRCLFVVQEIQRLKDACLDLEQHNMKAFGEKMFETHQGLSKKYEVSCKELDFLVDFVRTEESVLGARMMGGGFGGCTINLVRTDAVAALTERISAAYHKAFDIELKVYVASTEDGTSLISRP